KDKNGYTVLTHAKQMKRDHVSKLLIEEFGAKIQKLKKIQDIEPSTTEFISVNLKEDAKLARKKIEQDTMIEEEVEEEEEVKVDEHAKLRNCRVLKGENGVYYDVM